MNCFQPGERIHVIDKKERHYALTLKAGEMFQHSGDRIPHDSIIGKPDGSTTSKRSHVRVRPILTCGSSDPA